MSGSCHFDRASIVEIGVEYKIFAIIIFLELCPSFTIWGTFKVRVNQLKRDHF